MSKSKIHVSVFVLLLFVVLAGCSGGMPGAPTPPAPKLSKVEGQILVPDTTPAVVSSARSTLQLQWFSFAARAATGTTGLSGATVQALELPSLKPVGSTTETDASGGYTLTGLPMGKPVMIVAKKSVGDTNVRVSTFVPEVRETTRADADPATSMATEAFAAQLGQGSSYEVAAEDWEMARIAAETVIEQLTPSEYENLLVVGEGALSEFGDGLSDDEVYTSITDQVPEESDSDVRQAKAMVQSLRDAGHGLVDTVEVQLHRHRESLEEEVAPFFASLGDEIFHFIGRFNDVSLIGAHFDQGGTYAEVQTEDEWWDTCHEYGDWYDVCDDPYEMVNHRFQQSSGSPSDHLVLLSKDGKTKYELKEVGEFGMEFATSDQSGHIQHELKVTIHGDVDAERLDSIEVSGKIKKGNLDVRVDGLMKAENYGEFEETNVPREVTFSGKIESTTPAVYLNSEFTFGYEVEGHSRSDLKAMYIRSSGDMAFPTFKTESEFKMEFEIEVVNENMDGEIIEMPIPVRTTVDLNGLFSDREGTEFNGHYGFVAEIDRESYEPNFSGDHAPVTITFGGGVKTPFYPEIGLNATVNWVAEDKLESSVEYRRGNDTLEGTADIQLGEEFKVDLVLTNQNGLKTTLRHTANGANGAITKGNKTLAEVEASFDGIHFEFTDGTWQTLG